MESSDIFNQDYTKTDINGLPARYVLAKNPRDTEGGYVVAKVIDVPNPDSEASVSESIYNINPPRPPINPLYNFNTTPEHLEDPSKFIIQHRLGNRDLPYRRIDPELYTDEEKTWYTSGILPSQIREVMIYQLKCYCCGDFQISDDDIHWESTDYENRLGYKYCSSCKPYFRQAIFKTLAPIWVFRLKYEEWRNKNNLNLERPFIWVHRTRRDAEGKRDVLGSSPYIYTKWRIINWVPKKFSMVHYDETTKEVVRAEEYGVVVEQIDEQPNIVNDEYMCLTKIVPIYDILAINYDINTPNTQNTLKNLSTYDPNKDDPLNKYTYQDKHRGLRTGVNPCATA
jgi:hypothetical protein